MKRLFLSLSLSLSLSLARGVFVSMKIHLSLYFCCCADLSFRPAARCLEVLMQNQLDQILVSVKKENAALSQQISNEKAQRTLAQRSAREGKEVLSDQLVELSDLLKGLSNRVEALEKPWWKRIFSCDPRHHAKYQTLR